MSQLELRLLRLVILCSPECTFSGNCFNVLLQHLSSQNVFS